MPEFNRIGGEFITTYCTHRDRFIFKRNGWFLRTDEDGRKRWYTPDVERARAVEQYAVGAAREYLDNANAVRAAAVAASWAEDTDKDYPAPDGLAYMPFQKAGIEYAIQRERTLVADSPGLGKEQDVNTPILTPTGWKRMGDIVVGDKVIGSDGSSVTVTGVFPQGVKDNYIVHFRDGSSVNCGLDHLWKVSNKSWKGDKTRVVTLRHIIDAGVVQKYGKSKYKIPLVSPVNFAEKEYYIHPYVLGVLLGDGSLHGANPQITTHVNDKETRDRIATHIKEPYRLRTRQSGSVCQSNIARERGVGSSCSEYNAELDRLNIRVKGSEKRIPEEYMFGSVDQRIELLRGLMDSDGSISKIGNRVVFHNCNVDLTKDVQQLVWSLGGVGILRHHTRKDGKADEYQLNVKTHFNPFYLRRKAIRWTPSADSHKPMRHITEVEPNGKCEQVCIAVDAPDNLYVTKDYIVTHNTVQAVGVHNSVKTRDVLIICPASLKVNWSREWKKWDVHGLSVGIAMSIPRRKTVTDENGNKYVKTWTEHDFPDTDVVIVNYDMLDTFDEQIKDGYWDLVICDEAHLLKSQKAVRSLCVFGGVKKAVKKNGRTVTPRKEYEPILADRHLYLTGTPILSRPIELWNLIRACDRKGLGRDYTEYAFEYCAANYTINGLDVSGKSNLDKLNRLMRERFLVRRDKRAVLKELPEKTRETILLPKDKLESPVKKELSRVEKALAAYEEELGIREDNKFRFIDDLCQKLQDAIDAQDGEEPDWEAAVKMLSAPDQILFTEISAAREEVAMAKIGMVVEHVMKLYEAEEPVILFGFHKAVIKEIKERLEKNGVRVGVVVGDVPANKRQGIIDKFQDGEYDVILGNIMAMGVGYTLTRARIVVFAELDWVPSMIEQAEDRAWRHGQKNAVLVQYLIVDGSIEARMAMAIIEKMEAIYEALDDRD